jgi:hypothetical protein
VVCTSAAVTLRTRGKASSNTGNAINHDNAHAPSQFETSCGDMPIPLIVLINETIHVMKSESRKGIINAPYRAGNLGIPKMIVDLDLFEVFMVIS